MNSQVKRNLLATSRFVGAALIALFAGSQAMPQATLEPTWPQQFRVYAGEGPASVGFAMTQPGVITVQVTETQGVPLRAALVRAQVPNSPPVSFMNVSGTGSTIKFSYTATAADVQSSSLWVVQLSTLNLIPASPGGTGQPVASGTLSVQHPAANMATVMQKRPVLKAIAIAKPPVSAAALNAAYQQQIAAKHVAADAAFKQKVPVRQLATATPPATSTGPQISSLSVNQAQPGDLVTINGAGFGSPGGKVHFVVSPTMDEAVLADSWNNSLINVHMPDISGIGPYAGQLYLELSSGVKSAKLPFQFNPTIVYVDLRPGNSPPDSVIDQTDYDSAHSSQGVVVRNGSWDLLGHRGDDMFFVTTTLKNGWVVHSVAGGTQNILDTNSPCGCGGEVTESRVGTNSPYVKVHWWMNAFNWTQENVVVIIKGPKGTTYY